MAQLEYKLEKLSNDNYQTWKIVMQSQLRGKDLWDYVETVKMETDEDMISNEKAKTMMYLSMDSQQIIATGVCNTAFHLWEKIRENHEGATSSLRSSSLAEFLSMKHKKNETIVNYAGRFELALGKLVSTGHIVDEKTKLWVFSNSLPQHLKQTVQMFTMANPQGTVNQLISQLKIHHHMEYQDSDRQNAAYQVQERRQEHNNSKIYSTTMSNIICNYCKKRGHKWKDCRKLKSDDKRKKEYGQMNYNKNYSHDKQSPHKHFEKYQQNSGHQYKQGNQQSFNSRTSGAFNVRKHDFSEGKFTWIIDSGASSHITPYREFLDDYQEFETPHQIYLGNNESLEAHGRGNMPFTSDEFTGELKKVLYVPDISENLFSIGRAMEQNCNVEFNNEKHMVLFFKNNQIVLRGTKKPNSLYFLLELRPLAKQERANDGILLGASYEEWHKRYAHCSMEAVKALIRTDAVRGLKISNKEQHICRACTMGKLCRAHHPQRHKIKATASTAVLHIDTVGPMKKNSIGGSRYFVLATEEFSGYKFFETLGTKSFISEAVKRIINQAELDSGRAVKAILTDNGTEFSNEYLQRWLNKRGILHFYSATYTPEQNGRAERSNRTVLDGIRTLLNDSNLPEELWAEALNTIVYTTNRTLNTKSHNKTHYELLIGDKPDVRNLRIFGERAIVRDSDNARDGKLAPRGREVTFVGYTDRFNTYRFYMTKPVQQVIESCDVKFIGGTNDKLPNTRDYTAIVDEEETEIDENDSSSEMSSTLSGHDNITPSGSDTSDNTIIEQTDRPLTRNRAKLLNNQRHETDTNGPAIVGVHDNRESIMFTVTDEPRTLIDAQESSHWKNWKAAMDEEIKALRRNNTWVLVDRPDKIKPIKNKWVFKAKLKTDGTVDRFKARLVARGFSQIENVDYKETYAPVASMTTIRLFLAIANQNLMNLIQFDIKTAFLYGDLEETLFMEQPENYVEAPNKVCKLNKSIYGLKQAPRQWNKKFDYFLKIFSLEQSSVDKCLYYTSDKSMMLAIYVDDGLAAGRDMNQLNKLINHLRDNFELKVMNCENYLGFEIIRDNEMKTLSICQAHYIDIIINRFGMKDSKSTSTPEEIGTKFDESPPLPKENQFKELVGSLLYLSTCSRPDISHAVSIASRTSQPTQAHWIALKRILRYLKGTRDLGITFRWEQHCKLAGYSDADYANDPITRKSTTGYCIYFGGGPISWRCQRQPIITLSTTEAEYVAGCELVKELLPVRQQLIELNQIDEKEPTKIYIDNQSTVRIASNEAGQNRTKHIDIREKWLTEHVMKRNIEVEHISSDEQAADLLTKPLYKTKFITNRRKLLTQILTLTMMFAMLMIITDCRKLKLTDPVTPTRSEKVAIKGDVRYRIRNIFINPCQFLFNHSSTLYNTEQIIRYCFQHYEKTHLGPLTNCRKLATIGSDLSTVPLTSNCNDLSRKDGDNLPEGKCDLTRRSLEKVKLPELELEQLQEKWSRHKQFIDKLPSVQRTKRVAPLFVLGTIAILGIMTGPVIKTYKQTNANTDDIAHLANITELHARAIKESTQYLEDYRNSVQALHTWAADVEERLGDDPMVSYLTNDPIFRGRKANLVKTYMAWFNSQEKVLIDINAAASNRKIPSSIKPLVNETANFNIISNLSTLFDCNYWLEHGNLQLDLEFILPVIDDDIEILKVTANDVYTMRNTSEDGSSEICWEQYQGSDYMIHNKTNNCIKALNKNRETYTGIRGQTCIEPINDLYYPKNRNEIWNIEECTREVPKLLDRVQITEIEGAHKIYCYPFKIEIDDEQLDCPNSPFLVEGHAAYKISNITHGGAYIENTISRKANEDYIKRYKRSPVTGSSLVTTPQLMTTSKPVLVETTSQLPPRIKITETLTNLTGSMNSTLDKLKEVIKLIPTKINITRVEVDSFLNAPWELVSSGLEHISSYIKSIGTTLGLLTGVMMLIIIMPALELMIIGLKIAKVPANMWLGSAKRVTNHINEATKFSFGNLSGLFKKKRRKTWNDMTKII